MNDPQERDKWQKIQRQLPEWEERRDNRVNRYKVEKSKSLKRKLRNTTNSALELLGWIEEELSTEIEAAMDEAWATKDNPVDFEQVFWVLLIDLELMMKEAKDRLENSN